MLIFFGLVGLGLLLWFSYRQWQARRRQALFTAALSAARLRVLQNRVPIYTRLPLPLRQELHGLVNIFLHEKRFVGCAGLAISEEMRLTIAGNACLLLLKRDRNCFPGFTTILLYPDTYVTTEHVYDGLVETRAESVRSGESWQRGPVVLSWADVLRGAREGSAGHNVVLHEFAHKLDEENDSMDGLPVLRSRADYAQWAAVLSREFEALLVRVEQGRNEVLDEYGAVSAAEFFAVATESFFEKSRAMKQGLPELYRQLEKFYGLDPAAWPERH